MNPGPGKAGLLALVLGVVLLLDLGTKLLVQSRISPGAQMDVLGSVIRLTHVRNPGAAFGVYLGAWSRQVFLVLSAVVLAVLAAMYVFTPRGDRVRLFAIALISGGAMGNLIDRLRSALGVIDFIDIRLGSTHWPVFNVADMAVTTGAVVLALSLWQEDRRLERKE